MVAAILIAGCSAAGSQHPRPADAAAPGDRKELTVPAGPDASEERDAPRRRDEEGRGPAGPAPAAVGANELGVVPVLMYHRIVAGATSVDDRTPRDFRAELERLAREGYVPITAREFTDGRIDIPAGTHPVVLTFDDSAPSQFRLDADGRPDPDTAVGILLDVARRHPGFRPVATFFVNEDPFDDPGGRRTLRWLHDHGFEIGNHTLRHTLLSEAHEEMVRWDIAACRWAVHKVLPDVPVVSMALPYGAMPRPGRLAAAGEYAGVGYRHQGVYLAGAGPAPSPHSTDFEPGAIPRIRSQAPAGPGAPYGSTAWLDRLRDGGAERYTSDGDPERISFPRSLEHLLDPARRDAAHPY
ncbi:polysaccharide deacetylase family protein [Streptomyces sp. TRM43335]|uniref:Polysaccharide deacetylase family protein n=2 Tax=Streptomyces taklimakanensis TaxID=2569853 RepID=A0A6G2B6R8_9ACTN|nr:polysaccharide deacetylase family protein [Streptomyces taklimakanensis]